MDTYIHSEQRGIYIIDLRQTLKALGEAYVYARNLVANGGVLLFVGTKPSIADNVKLYAEKCGMPYVNERWLGGTLTNFFTVSSQTAKLHEYRDMEEQGLYEKMPKKEALQYQREMSRLMRNLGGVRNMKAVPNAIFILDTLKEHIAVVEAQKLKIPIIAVVDTNCNPEEIDYVIPGNDDSILSGELMCRVVCEAVMEGQRRKQESSSEPTQETEGTQETEDTQEVKQIQDTEDTQDRQDTEQLEQTPDTQNAEQVEQTPDAEQVEDTQEAAETEDVQGTEKTPETPETRTNADPDNAEPTPDNASDNASNNASDNASTAETGLDSQAESD